MAATPRFKVYDSNGEYQAATKRPEEAAAVVALLGEGSTIRTEHSKKSIVWSEGKEECLAGDSYDVVAQTVYERCGPKNG